MAKQLHSITTQPDLFGYQRLEVRWTDGKRFLTEMYERLTLAEAESVMEAILEREDPFSGGSAEEK